MPSGEGGNEKAIAHKAFFETKEDILGKVGTYIIAGQPDKSGLLKICSQEMPVGEQAVVMPPPKAEVPKFTDEDVAAFATWISQGAKNN